MTAIERVEKVLTDSGISLGPIPRGLSQWGPACANCGADEYRIDGYCSMECRDVHALCHEILDALDEGEAQSIGPAARAAELRGGEIEDA